MTRYCETIKLININEKCQIILLIDLFRVFFILKTIVLFL